MSQLIIWTVLVIVLGGTALYRLWVRLQLSRAKHPSLRGHAKWSRRVARQIPYFEYDESRFFDCDGAPDSIREQRRDAMQRLGSDLKERAPRGIEFTQSLKDSISDVRFTNAYRVPFPFRRITQQILPLDTVVEESNGVRVRDLDGNWNIDLTGSYGVNVFGYDFYKDCMQDAAVMAGNMGPVLGPYHPVIADNVERLKAISGLDEVSFHMSGTEAVMQAVRLARYHSGRSHLVRFCGAYHGWWDGVQPGVGNQRQTGDVYTLADMSEQTMQVLETRKDIACILINPLQALHPNSDAASDASLVASDRGAKPDRKAYGEWLQRLREVCTERGIVLIMDEVFTGFRLARRGAQEYFGVQADIVTYGKTLGGGYPVGVVCGRHDLMKRYQDERPVNISFARGTFNSHPYVMGAMNAFLHKIESNQVSAIYESLDVTWENRLQQLNARLQTENLPVQIAALSTIWTVLYSEPCRYNWMFQYYLRKNGLALSWVGSGRIIMSLNFTDQDFSDMTDCFVAAAKDMQQNGWWWHPPELSNKSIKRQMLKEMLATRFPILGGWIKPEVEVKTSQQLHEAHGHD